MWVIYKTKMLIRGRRWTQPPLPPLQKFSSFPPGVAHQRLSEIARSRSELKIVFQEAQKRTPGAAPEILTPQQWRPGWVFIFKRLWADHKLKRLFLTEVQTQCLGIDSNNNDSNPWVEVRCASSFHAFSPCFTKSWPSRCFYPHFTDVEIGFVMWLPQTLQRRAKPHLELTLAPLQSLCSSC